MGLISSSKSIIGLDIGSHAVKAIVLDQVKSGLTLGSVGLVQLPPDAIEEGVIQEPDTIAAAIKNLLKNIKVKNKLVSTSVSGYSVIIKKITLPTATREELADNIEIEAEQFIPFDISEVNVDFQIIGQSEQNPNQMDVILAAAKKDIIESYMGLLQISGLKPNVIDVDVFALENAFTYNYPDVKETVALIDIGANKMNMNVIKGGMSLLTKDAAMGGARITAELQDVFDVDFQTAEAIKMGAQSAPHPETLTEIVERSAAHWVAESQRTIDFMEASYPGERLSRIFLSGGSCRIVGLDRYFEKEIGVPVQIFNPFHQIGINQKRFDPAYLEYLAPQVAICLGLALRMGEAL